MKNKFSIRLALAGLFICAASALASAQGYRYDNIALLDTGRPANSATVRVCSSGSTGTPCTPLASVFSDSGLSVSLGNLTSDTLGNYGFYANCNKYDVQISGSGLTTRTMKDVQVGPCNSSSALTVGSNLVTQSSPRVSARSLSGGGNEYEFGHTNTAGYGSNMGADSGSGSPWICFFCEASATSNQYRTRGNVGRIVRADQASNVLQFGRIATANADNQTPTVDLSIDGSGNVAVSTSLAVGGDTKMSNAPRMIWAVDYTGTLPSSGFALNQVVLDKPVTVTRLRVVLNQGALSGCTTAPTFSVSDGTNTASCTITNTNSSCDTGAVSVNLVGNGSSTSQISVSTFAGCALVSNAEISVQYKMQ